MARGASVADAHRSLAQRLLTEDTVRERDAQGRPRVLVLVAERDEFSAEFIEFLLRTEGFGVEVALDIDHAKRIFDLRSPDLVIVELLVGGGDGEGLCRWLKDRGAGPVLVVSGLDAADRSLRAGADAFLRKPVGHLQLLTAVKDLLGVSAILAREG
jgi:DNA-binding response OmpR family regulator